MIPVAQRNALYPGSNRIAGHISIFGVSPGPYHWPTEREMRDNFAAWWDALPGPCHFLTINSEDEYSAINPEHGGQNRIEIARCYRAARSVAKNVRLGFQAPFWLSGPNSGSAYQDPEFRSWLANQAEIQYLSAALYAKMKSGPGGVPWQEMVAQRATYGLEALRDTGLPMYPVVSPWVFNPGGEDASFIDLGRMDLLRNVVHNVCPVYAANAVMWTRGGEEALVEATREELG